MKRLSLWCGWLLLFVLAACSNESDPTSILVVVDGDAEVRARLSKLHVAVYAPDDLTVVERQLDFTVGENGQYNVPLSFALLPERGAHRRTFRLVVTGRGRDAAGTETDLIEQHVVTTFRSGHELRLDVFLSDNCLLRLCRDASGQPTGASCQASTGLCRAAPVLDNLPEADRTPLGGYDGGVELDASADAASDAAGADALVEVDDCIGHGCQHGAVCVDRTDASVCDCTGTGYRGALCEIDINECNDEHLCKSLDYPCVQTSPPGYTCRGQMADWPMPDSTPGASTPASYDVTSVPGVVIDNVTGLQWQRERPLSYLGCSGMRELPYDICSWPEAVGYCNALVLAGHDDWRLPSKIELESILDLTRASIKVDLTIFPDTKADWYQTSSPYVDTPGLVWMVSFEYGANNQFPIVEKQYVRCVR